jgi:hypothetical protein
MPRRASKAILQMFRDRPASGHRPTRHRCPDAGRTGTAPRTSPAPRPPAALRLFLGGCAPATASCARRYPRAGPRSPPKTGRLGRPRERLSEVSLRVTPLGKHRLDVAWRIAHLVDRGARVDRSGIRPAMSGLCQVNLGVARSEDRGGKPLDLLGQLDELRRADRSWRFSSSSSRSRSRLARRASDVACSSGSMLTR